MQKMKKYFGFRVKVSDFLEPIDYKVIRNKLFDLIQQGRIDLTKYRIYLHQLALEADTTHFGVSGGIEGRIEKIYLKFAINQKQRRSGDIQFANNLFSKELNEDNKPFYLPYEVGYTIPSSFFRDRDWFQNVLVTLVREGLRESHKKIKVKVAAEAKPDFVERLRRKEAVNSETNIILKFDEAIEFNRQTRLFTGQDENPQNEGNNIMKPENKGNTGPVINISGGTIGGLQVQSPSASQTNSVTVLNSPELLDHVLKELRTLHAGLQTKHPSQVPPKEMAIIEGVLAEAPKNPEALARLKTIGKWFLTRAEKVGLSLLTDLIKGELGI